MQNRELSQRQVSIFLNKDNKKLLERHLGELYNCSSKIVSSKFMTNALNHSIATLNLSLERDIFLRTLIRELSGTLQDIVGLEEASGFISVVGERIGRQINQDYKSALEVSNLSRKQVADVLIDLKRRIQGDFYVIEQDDKKIVFGNRVCPFAEKVLNRPAMCMMTSNVFGTIAANNLGYAKVELQETIAQGASGCRVIVYLKLTEEAEDAEGREYFRGLESV